MSILTRIFQIYRSATGSCTNQQEHMSAPFLPLRAAAAGAWWCCCGARLAGLLLAGILLTFIHFFVGYTRTVSVNSIGSVPQPA